MQILIFKKEEEEEKTWIGKFRKELWVTCDFSEKAFSKFVSFPVHFYLMHMYSTFTSNSKLSLTIFFK